MTLEMDVKAFGVFTNWLYTKTIVDSSGGTPNVDVLANLWIFAERILHPELQNEVMNHLHDRLYDPCLVDRRAFGTFCNIADRHANGESCLVDLAADVLSWLPPGRMREKHMHMIPLSMLAKSWRSMKQEQIFDAKTKSKAKLYHVKVPEAKK